MSGRRFALVDLAETAIHSVAVVQEDPVIAQRGPGNAISIPKTEPPSTDEEFAMIRAARRGLAGWIEVRHPLVHGDRLPPDGKVVLVFCAGDAKHGGALPYCAYVKRLSEGQPYWVVYHRQPRPAHGVVAWCDCLPEKAPSWRPSPTYQMYPGGITTVPPGVDARDLTAQMVRERARMEELDVRSWNERTEAAAEGYEVGELDIRMYPMGPIWVYVAWGAGESSPVGFVWCTRESHQGGGTTILSLGSYVRPIARRKGVRTAIHRAMMEHEEAPVIVQTRVGSSDGGRAWLDAVGFTYDHHHRLWSYPAPADDTSSMEANSCS